MKGKYSDLPEMTLYRLANQPESEFYLFLRETAFLRFFIKNGLGREKELDKWELFEMGYRTEQQVRDDPRICIRQSSDRKMYLLDK